MRLIHVSPSGGGVDCETAGRKVEDRKCEKIMKCPWDCGFTEWSEWGDCNVTCGDGHRNKNRTLKQAEHGGSAECPEGALLESKGCVQKECGEMIKAGASLLGLAVAVKALVFFIVMQF